MTIATVDTYVTAAVAAVDWKIHATDRANDVSRTGMHPGKPSLDDDRLLVERVLARSPRAFEALVRQYQGLCWHVVSRMVRNHEDARDVCQEAFLRVHRYLHQYRFESPLRSWIAQVAYSAARRHLERKRIPLIEATGDGDSSDLIAEAGDTFDLEAASANAELMTLMRAEIDALPPLNRTLLTLYYLDELPIGEIAGITGIAAGTIKSHLFRSRARLRVRLEIRMRARK